MAETLQKSQKSMHLGKGKRAFIEERRSKLFKKMPGRPGEMLLGPFLTLKPMRDNVGLCGIMWSKFHPCIMLDCNCGGEKRAKNDQK